MLSRKFALSFAALILMSVLAACGGGGGDDSNNARIQGTAILPAGVDPVKGVAANAPVQVIDLTRPSNANVVATSTTDANGRYDVTFGESPLVAVVVQGKVQVSGLVQADRNKDFEISKDFTGSTDIACRGAVQALTGGSLSLDDVSSERITNLENAALFLVSQGEVDFNDEASVLAAVETVLLATDFGAHPLATL